MGWSLVICQYEGAGYGDTVEILVESEKIQEVRELIRNNRDTIEGFYEHSVANEYVYPITNPSVQFNIESETDIREILSDPFNPNYAITADGTVWKMKNYGEVVTK
jgi:hypothetical protein